MRKIGFQTVGTNMYVLGNTPEFIGGKQSLYIKDGLKNFERLHTKNIKKANLYNIVLNLLTKSV